MAVLVLVDVQKEYITEGRPFCLETIGESLENLRRLLAHGRKMGWKIVHMRHQQNAECFSYGSEYSEFIDGFGPQGNEADLVKTDFSCFSCPEFQALVDRARHQEIILAGYGATMCCLSTLIDAHLCQAFRTFWRTRHEGTYCGYHGCLRKSDHHGRAAQPQGRCVAF